MQSIRSERLCLRLPRPNDAEAIFEEYASDPEVTRYLAWRPHSSTETVRAFLQEALDRVPHGKRLPFVIERAPDARVIGMIDAMIRGHIATIGYVLSSAHWGNGYITEAFKALIPHLWARPDIHRIQAFCDVEHKASARVMEKCGLLYEGTLRSWFVHPQLSDQPRDCLMYAMVRQSAPDAGQIDP